MTGFYTDKTCGGGPNGENVPYVMGTARGIRSFAVDAFGWLRGVTYPQAWTPGENVAKCFVTTPENTVHMFLQHITSGAGGWSHGSYSVAGWRFPIEENPNSQPSLEDGYSDRSCKGLTRNCSCGFYAYHSQLAGYGNRERAVAVIEGYGRVILGTKGFRCEKARIVAIVMPTIVNKAREMETLRERLAEYERTLAALPTGAWQWARTTRGIAVLAAVVAVMGGINQTNAFLLGSTLGFLTGLAIFVETHARHALRIFERVVHHAMNDVAERLHAVQRVNMWTERAERLRQNYPDVPVFDSVEAMLEAFPTTDLGYLVDPKLDHPNS